jgi:glycosyltransferase involved in cell wall biosynthesis
VVTIHDLNYHFHPEDFSWAALWVHRFLVPMAAKRCSKVFTGSHFSEQSIRHILGTPQEKVTTIYYAADGNFREEMTPQDIDQMKKTFGLGGDFILSITGSYPHKNLGGLLEAYRVLCENYRMEMPLVLVGVKGTSHSVVAKWTAQNPHCGRVVVTGWLASKDLAGLYSSALFFVFPSKYEGFGFPVLEAMGFGLPVISSSAASLPELVGDAGILVDPESPESLAEAMLKCLNDSFLRKQLSEKGRERFKKFSWKETVKQTLREYMAVIRNGVS